MKIKILLIAGALLSLSAVCTAQTTPPPSTLTVEWDDNSTGETAFEIERAPAAPSTAFVKVGQVAANVKTFVDEGLQPKTSYQYRVRAVTGDPDEASAWSNVATGRTKAIPLTAPGRTRVTGGATVATLTIERGQELVVLVK